MDPKRLYEFYEELSESWEHTDEISIIWMNAVGENPEWRKKSRQQGLVIGLFYSCLYVLVLEVSAFIYERMEKDKDVGTEVSVSKELHQQVLATYREMKEMRDMLQEAGFCVDYEKWFACCMEVNDRWKRGHHRG
jgi:response regulator RpfG family c-di-GMP phosphodiesterase